MKIKMQNASMSVWQRWIERVREKGRIIDSLELELLIFKEDKTESCVFKW